MKIYFDILGVLKRVIEACLPHTSVRSVCELGDTLLIEETSKVFKKEKDMRKGIFKFLYFCYAAIC